MFDGEVIKGTQVQGPKGVEDVSQVRFVHLMTKHPMRHLRSNGKPGGSRKWVVCRNESKLPAPVAAVADVAVAGADAAEGGGAPEAVAAAPPA
eukprot:gene14580-30414_t